MYTVVVPNIERAHLRKDKLTPKQKRHSACESAVDNEDAPELSAESLSLSGLRE